MLERILLVYNIYIKNYKFKNKVGIQVIKVVKQEMNDGSYYSIAQWEIPTLVWYSNYFVFNAKVGISHRAML